MCAHFIRRTICAVVAAALLWQAPVAGAARAAMVTTETVLQTERAKPAGAEAAGRDRLRAFLRRQDVRAQLTALGVDPAEATARVESLSDAEVAPLVARIDSLPAGAEGQILSTGDTVLLFLALIAAIVIILGFLWGFISAVRDSSKGDTDGAPGSPPSDPKPGKAPPAPPPAGS